MAGGGVGSTDRVALTTIEEWAKDVSEETTRYLVVLALMKKKGRIQYGCSGGQFRWVIRTDKHQLRPFKDMVPVDFQRVNTKTSAYLGWRGYYGSDSVSLREKLEQGGPEAMIKVFANRSDLIKRGLMDGLAAELFKDGETTANTALETFHGIESFMGIGAQTASDIIATTNDDTYAGLSTAVAGLSSDFTRCFTPCIINSNHTPSGGSQQLWASFADQYIREMVFRTKFGHGPDSKMDLILLNRDSYVALLNLMDDKERIQVSRGSGIALTQLGFGDHVEIDGCAVTWDDSVPTTDAAPYGADDVTMQGYGLTTGQMQLKVLGPKGSKDLFTPKVTFNDAYRADHIFMHLLGNLKFEGVRHFGKFAEISAVAS